MSSFFEDIKYKLKSDTRTNFIDEEKYRSLINVYHLDDNLKVMQTYNVDEVQLLNLCGGVPSEDISIIDMSIESASPHTLTVKTSTNLYDVRRRIYFEDLEIFNDQWTMRKHSYRKNRIGTYAFINQIREARKLGFGQFNVVAKGGRHLHPPDRWNGHYTWGRLCYEMHPLAVEDFKEWLEENKLPNQTLHQLLSSEEGRDLWKVKGRTWSGYFQLQDNCSCVNNLQNYLKEAGIRARL